MHSKKKTVSESYITGSFQPLNFNELKWQMIKKSEF